MNDNVYNIGDRTRRTIPPERPLSERLSEVANEFKEFAETRIAMFRSEMREKIAMVKFAAPLAIIGALFAVTAWLLLTGAIVAAIAVAFAHNAYGPFMALLCVGILFLIIGGAALWMAYGRLKTQSLMPERTLNVLKEDKVWLQTERRTQL
ncbi:MAG TPA: phage holin family protein [Terriglobales bacterium]|nr:phage holin family protein [Terriglobales bacterium]